MRRPIALAQAYAASPFARERGEYLTGLRAALPDLFPASYRGIGRYPLNAEHDYEDPGWQWQWDDREPREQLATLAVAELLGVEEGRFPVDEWLVDRPWLLPDLSGARHVASLLENEATHEIVEVARYPSRTRAASMGFDVGYWASGNFSIICDTAVWPIWHPLPLDAVRNLESLLRLLNHAGLFPDANSAERFRDAYRAQNGAEEDESDFEVVEVASVDTQ